MSKSAWDHVTLQAIADCFQKAGFLSENVENTGDEESYNE